MILPGEHTIYCAVHFILLWFSVPSSLPSFFNATNSKDRPTADGKNSAKCGANLLAEHSNIECDDVFAVSFVDPQREFYKFHPLLGSVGELNGDKL